MIGAFLYFRRIYRRYHDISAQLVARESEVLMYRKTWHINPRDIQLIDCIGKGAVGEVFKARWRGMLVAVKTIRGGWMTIEEMEKEMDNEATMLQAVRHKHVVQFYGAGTLIDNTPFVVTELMDRNLRQVLSNVNISLNWHTKQRFACEAAQGMSVVHSLGRIHRDLKSSNLLVTLIGGMLQLKVADFGTATLVNLATGETGEPEEMTHARSLVSSFGSGAENLTKMVGTPLWMAPEILGGKSYGLSADLYSFGIVMWEIASREEPWKELENTSFFFEKFYLLLQQGQRPKVDESWPTTYVTVMKQCWSTDPQARPSFSDVLKALEKGGGANSNDWQSEPGDRHIAFHDRQAEEVFTARSGSIRTGDSGQGRSSILRSQSRGISGVSMATSDIDKENNAERELLQI